MNNRALVLLNALLGTIGGVAIFIALWIILGAAATGEESVVTAVTTGIYLLKLSFIVLSIIAMVYLKGDKRIDSAPHVLMLIGGIISLIPFLGWLGGILAFISGIFYLVALKKF